jgi:hypothetical protein
MVVTLASKRRWKAKFHGGLCTSILELHRVKTLEGIKELVQFERVAAVCESKAFRLTKQSGSTLMLTT